MSAAVLELAEQRRAAAVAAGINPGDWQHIIDVIRAWDGLRELPPGTQAWDLAARTWLEHLLVVMKVPVIEKLMAVSGLAANLLWQLTVGGLVARSDLFLTQDTQRQIQDSH